ncbi:hypothetical protein LINGRAHAP2_LOCUS20874 [Linum grandiflorum]
MRAGQLGSCLIFLASKG